jgi:hypothetical protein
MAFFKRPGGDASADVQLDHHYETESELLSVRSRAAARTIRD